MQINFLDILAIVQIPFPQELLKFKLLSAPEICSHYFHILYICPRSKYSQASEF